MNTNKKERRKRRGLPPSKGVYVVLEVSLNSLLDEQADNLGVTKAQLVNESIRHGIKKATELARV